jgi:hypothetical protein
MSKKQTKSTRGHGSLDRRQFLGTTALGMGAVLAGLSREVVGQNAPPARPAPPPEPTASQPAPLKNLKGKVAYITAASDGIGLGSARAAPTPA